MTSLQELRALASLSVFVTAIYAAALLPIGACFLLLRDWTSPAAWALLLLLLLLTATPHAWTDWPAAHALMGGICGSACDYFPITVRLQDEDSLKPGQSYVLGYEPHSALPVGIPAVFASPSPRLPKFLRGAANFHGLASGLCFRAPFVRQLWWWLGLRPATKEVMEQILGAGGSVLLCPGGVQECLAMTKGEEVIYLKRRQGFVRLALQHGSSLVPVFAFGQSSSYTWYRPGPPLVPQKLLEWASRKAGAVPLVMLGRWASPIPNQAAITVVVGRPIPVPKVMDPPAQLVEQYLDRFIAEMQLLFDTHKAACGQEAVQLRIL